MRIWERLLLSLVLLAGLIGLRSGASAQAQEGRELQYGDVVDGAINADAPRQVYYFQARQGDVVSVTMNRLSGNLDMQLVLADNAGQVLAESDDQGGDGGAAIDGYQIEADDFYFVIATRFGHGLGLTEGAFSLRLERVGVTSESGAYLSYGDSVVGFVSRQTPHLNYVFEARQGDIVNITMQRISGNLDSYLTVTNDQGLVVATNDDGPNGLDAALTDFLIIEPGLYTIAASRFGEEAGTTEGSFVLTLDTAPISGQGLTADAALFLRYGEELSHTLDDEVFARYYTFGAKRGDIVTVSMTRAGGDLDPLVVLLNEAQEPLQQDDDSGPSNNALLQSFIIPETGTYYIMATRFDGAAGRTTGDYTVRLDGVSGEAPVVAPGTLTILYDSQVNGIIDDASVAVSYAFLGNAGDSITISLNQTSGDLDPVLLLFTADSEQLASDDDSGPEKNARIAGQVLPADGIYYIVASRYEYQDGTTSGGYALSLSLNPRVEATAAPAAD